MIYGHSDQFLSSNKPKLVENEEDLRTTTSSAPSKNQPEMNAENLKKC